MQKIDLRGEDERFMHHVYTRFYIMLRNRFRLKWSAPAINMILNRRITKGVVNPYKVFAYTHRLDFIKRLSQYFNRYELYRMGLLDLKRSVFRFYHESAIVLPFYEPYAYSFTTPTGVQFVGTRGWDGKSIDKKYRYITIGKCECHYIDGFSCPDNRIYVLTEGFFDALSGSVLLGAEDFLCMATAGVYRAERIIKQFDRHIPILLALDPDEAGNRVAKDMMTKYENVFKIQMPLHTDMNDFVKEKGVITEDMKTQIKDMCRTMSYEDTKKTFTLQFERKTSSRA